MQFIIKYDQLDMSKKQTRNESQKMKHHLANLSLTLHEATLTK